MTSTYKQQIHALLFTGLLAISICAPACAESLYSDLPDIGDSAGATISPEQEKQLGAYMMRQLRQSGIVLNNLEITAYLNSLGQRLVANSEEPARQFTFFVVNEPSINAFAGPGGYIGVHTGLFMASENESELAGVLAHEIAHVTQHHLARAFEAAESLSVPHLAAMLASILVSTQNAEAGMAGMAAVTAGAMQYQINFTRANEYEADRVGIQTLANSDIDPYGMPRFFERLQKSSRLYGNRPPEFLSTHPVTTNRIAEATSRAERYPAGKIDNLDFQLVRAKLKVLNYSDPQQVMEDVQRYRDKSETAKVYKKYEYALLLARTGKSGQALEILDGLHRADPDRIMYRIDIASLYTDSGNYEKALGLYKDALSLYPGNLTILLPYTRTLLVAGKAPEAYKILSDLIKKQYSNPHIYKLLAQAAEETGRKVESHGAMSRYYNLNGNTRQAIQQLQLASREPRVTDYENARIQAKLKELKELLEEEDKMK
jgi:predicted Zn-dependent protease